VSANNKERFTVQLMNQDGNWVADIANTQGPADETTTGEVPADGVYIVRVISDGDWTLEITQ
jgi:hypothetical protein